MARYAGGSLAQAIYVSILANTQAARAAVSVPAAVLQAGGSATMASEILAAFPSGALALAKVPGVNAQILGAAGSAYQFAYAHALSITALSSLAFGGVGLICCLLCENIDAKVSDFIVPGGGLPADSNRTDERYHEHLPGERCQRCSQRVPLIRSRNTHTETRQLHTYYQAVLDSDVIPTECFCFMSVQAIYISVLRSAVSQVHLSPGSMMVCQHRPHIPTSRYQIAVSTRGRLCRGTRRPAISMRTDDTGVL